MCYFESIMNRQFRYNIFLQVRLSSRRLPQKALLPLAGKSIFEHTLEALSQSSVDGFIVLTDEASAEILSPYCKDFGFSLFSGPLNDVLKRFSLGLDSYPADYIIRATGDNPLVSHEIINTLIQLTEDEESRSDYSVLNGVPIGVGVECLSAKALKRADNEAAGNYNREHVAPYLYRNPDLFSCLFSEAPTKWRSEKSVTVDSEEEYRCLQRIYDDLYNGKPIPLEVLVRYLNA